ncbi:MAG: hypothetical protein H6819_10560 [Phycisphaerales bacterium]|nr:hypothetical protein [Phycisphaerales bacterium]MCB9855930.1 hypothetical protein [Phycisphaerales bacterium]MCB9864089.1 hypothetical protein [Phycisphaerales bacterium]
MNRFNILAGGLICLFGFVSITGGATLSPVIDGYVSNTVANGPFINVNTTGDSALALVQSSHEDRAIFEFDVRSYGSGAVIDSLSFRFRIVASNSSSQGPHTINFYAYSGDGAITAADATVSGTLIGSLVAPDLGVMEIAVDGATIEALIQSSDYLGIRIQSTGPGGIFVGTTEHFVAEFRPTLSLLPDRVWHVNDDAAPGGDGLTWATAFNDLQMAMDSAQPGEEIWVAEGVYRPTKRTIAADPRSATFELRNGTRLYGGFHGFETTRRIRHPFEIKSTLHGDLLADDVGFSNRGDNAYHVVSALFGTTDAVIDGFDITRGNASGATPDRQIGAGFYASSGTPYVRNCTIRDNSASNQGDGAYCSNSSGNTYFINCIFDQHTSGEALRLSGSTTNATILNCLFTRYDRGLITGTATAHVTNSIFKANTGFTTFESDHISGNIIINRSCVQNWTGNFGGQGNFGDDPMLVSFGTSGSDYHTLPGSPCRDAGDASDFPPDIDDLDEDGDFDEPMPIDLSGQTRIADDTCQADTGVPDAGGAVIDIGPYEYSPTQPAPTTSRLYVDPMAMGANNGTSWSDAFVELRDAMDAAYYHPCAGVEEIWVVSGTYLPSDAADRFASFKLSDDVKVYGGFSGGENALEQRNADPMTNGSILSGNIGDANATDNVYTVVDVTRSSALATLDGFTITGGYADQRSSTSPRGTGGGIFGLESNLHLRNLRITDNIAYVGGGVNIDDGNPVFEDCTIDSNTLFENVNVNRAAGVNIGIGLRPEFRRCRFLNNQRETAIGGALSFRGSVGRIPIVDCDFEDNIAGIGGAISYDLNASVDIVNCRFRNNRGYVESFPNSHSGALFLLGGDVTLTNCEFVGNVGRNFGGAIVSGYLSNLEISNCTFTDNHTDGNGGGIIAIASTITIRNSILWGNTDNGGANGDAGAQIYDESSDGPNTITMEYSCVQDGNPGDGSVYVGAGNIDVDPQFVGVDDVHLSMTSPCLDAGDNTGVAPDVLDIDGNADTAEPIPYDLDGVARFSDAPAVDTGNPDGVHPIVDMGAYELVSSFVARLGDMNCDTLVDGRDVEPFILAMTDPLEFMARYPDCNAANGDIDENSVLELADLPGFIYLLLDRSVEFRPGDMNCDGLVNGIDVGAFALAVTDPAHFESTFPNCSLLNGDLSGDQTVQLDDLPFFVDLLLAD